MTEKHTRKFSKIPPEMLKRLLSLPREEGIRLFERINRRIHLERDSILNQAFEGKLLTKKEYKEKYKDMFYDNYGADSFTQYIDAVMNSKADCFVTENERMLKRKEELKGKFGLRVASPKEILEEHEK